MNIEHLKVNIRSAHKMASNWVMAGASSGAAIYLALPAEAQTNLVAGISAHLPVPVYMIPVAVGVLGFVARVWPQKSITLAEAEAKSAS